jgi:hypothetical protein
LLSKATVPDGVAALGVTVAVSVTGWFVAGLDGATDSPVAV